MRARTKQHVSVHDRAHGVCGRHLHRVGGTPCIVECERSRPPSGAARHPQRSIGTPYGDSGRESRPQRGAREDLSVRVNVFLNRYLLDYYYQEHVMPIYAE